ncbi:MAG: SpoIVB peptidase [Epulopiscium sp. Nuni2H_MBin003]|nr:MAG: SpoIVB peptidase [Epulopiscium sp. Nuni2H_MBin003]
MENQQLKKVLFCMLTIITIFTVLSPVIITNYYLPNEINMVAGREYSLDFEIPIKARIRAQDQDLILDNNNVLNGQQSINLNDPLMVTVNSEGNADLEISLLGGIPIKTVSVFAIPKQSVIPGGEVVGIEVHSDGICVVGSGEFSSYGENINPCKGKLKKGDRIISVNDKTINTKEDFQLFVEQNQDSPITLQIIRGKKQLEVDVTPRYSDEQQSYKIGVWIKDTVQGLGTLTYVDPKTGNFGALGHGITDSDFDNIIPISYGKIMEAQVDGIKKGEAGEPGEISGIINTSESAELGEIRNNTSSGIFGTMQTEDIADKKLVEIATQSEVKEGIAYILADLTGDGVSQYDVKVQKIAKHMSEPSKGMIIKIIDEELLNLTQGIVQGMSGSPIIQDDKLIGAISHVFVNDPTTGYGIFIEHMLQNE